MSKLIFAGLLSWFSGGILLLLNSISSSMDMIGIIEWNDLILLNVVGKDSFAWIEALPWVILQQGFSYIANLPLYVLLFCAGIIFFVVNALKTKI